MLDRAAVNPGLRLALLPAPPPDTDSAKLLTFVKQEYENLSLLHKGPHDAGPSLRPQSLTRVRTTLVVHTLLFYEGQKFG